MSGCHYCGTEENTRPYGPGGSAICFPCMKADPARERAAEASFETQLDAAEAMSPLGGVVLLPGGPQPMLPEDLGLRPE